MKKILGISLVLGLTYCSVADNSDDGMEDAALTDSTAKTPCDSIETTMYDQTGNQYTVKMPCDSASWPKGDPTDTVVRWKR